jgi:putative ABC transport system permease protein
MATTVNSKFVNKIIKHYLKYDKDNPFIFISSIMAFLSIAVGIAVLMIAMGMMNGTENEFKKRLFQMDYPLTLIPLGQDITTDELATKLSNEFPTLKFSPYYRTQIITKSGSNIKGSMLYGVDFEKEKELNEIFKKAYASSLSTKSKFKIVAGEKLVEDMFIKKGDKLSLYFTSGMQTIGFNSMPFLQKRFIVDATYSSGISTYDEFIMYTTHEAFHKILKRKKSVYDGIHIFSNNAMEDADKINAFLKKEGYANKTRIIGWWEQHANFFAAMEMEKNALFLALLLIIIVASLNIISSLLMTVMSRRPEIALMKTLGATNIEIKNIFLKLGAIIGVGGIIGGTILGFFSIWVLTTFDIITLSADVYGFSKLPIDLTPTDFFSIIIGAIIIVLASSRYPAKKAASTDPLIVLRNE